VLIDHPNSLDEMAILMFLVENLREIQKELDGEQERKICGEWKWLKSFKCDQTIHQIAANKPNNYERNSIVSLHYYN
jgi:hypothetical protein